MKTNSILLAISLLLIQLSCTSPEKAPDKKAPAKEVKEEEHKTWSYTGETSPEHWAELEDGSACDGIHQSPINIVDSNINAGSATITIAKTLYQEFCSVKSITNNGHTVRYDFDSEENFIQVDERQYTLKQFHFHAPSEHTINGEHFPMEIHMVHFSEEYNAYVVVAVLMEEGAEDTAFNFLERHLPIAVGETKPVDYNYRFHQHFPEMDTLKFYDYKGSLTTPPCSENVQWLILKDHLKLSKEQGLVFKEMLPANNYRKTQPLNNREIVLDKMLSPEGER